MLELHKSRKSTVRTKNWLAQGHLANDSPSWGTAGCHRTDPLQAPGDLHSSDGYSEDVFASLYLPVCLSLCLLSERHMSHPPTFTYCLGHNYSHGPCSRNNACKIGSHYAPKRKQNGVWIHVITSSSSGLGGKLSWLAISTQSMYLKRVRLLWDKKGIVSKRK